MKEWNFYVDGVGFNTYQEARTYADELLVSENKYRCIFTKDEMDSVESFLQQSKENQQ